jgi:hypothetical protein
MREEGPIYRFAAHSQEAGAASQHFPLRDTFMTLCGGYLTLYRNALTPNRISR